ncbi:MAG: hypothetical protein PHC53_02705 [Patescibacteria group bacterium]|nr:hypothetical protein [Patescibacteria group bacterium]
MNQIVLPDEPKLKDAVLTPELVKKGSEENSGCLMALAKLVLTYILWKIFGLVAAIPLSLALAVLIVNFNVAKDTAKLLIEIFVLLCLIPAYLTARWIVEKVARRKKV